MINDILGSAEAVGKGASAVMDIITTISDRYEKWKHVRENSASIIRLLYLEVCKNIELLSVLIDTDNASLNCADNDLIFFISNFETSIIEMILCGNDEAEAFNILRKKGRIQEHEELTVKKTKKIQKYENVLQAMRFVYVKIDLLRKINALHCKNDLIKNIRVYERMKNIELRLLLIKKIIGDIDANEIIS